MQPQSQGTGRVAAQLFSARPRQFIAPSRGTGSSEIGGDGCPEWGAECCRRSAWGSAVYLERVDTVREIEVLSTELLDIDPYIVP